MAATSPGARGFRRHAWAFVLANVALTVVNVLSGRPWWAFWPLMVWAVALGIHYLVYRARSVDDEWVDTRIADLHSKSYDVSHIDSIAERSERGEMAPPVPGTTRRE